MRKYGPLVAVLVFLGAGTVLSQITNLSTGSAGLAQPAPAGTQSAPGISLNTTNMGLFLDGAGVIGFAVAGARAFDISATQAYNTTIGSAATPSFGVGTSANSGLYSPTANASIGLSAAGAARFDVCGPKTLSNTSATLTTLATVGAASNTAGGMSVTFTVTCTDGTNFDSDTVTCTESWVNKAGVITVGTAACTASTAANNSGSCTVAPTFTGGSSVININVTPVITTIAPTTTLGYSTITTQAAGAVVCN